MWKRGVVASNREPPESDRAAAYAARVRAGQDRSYPAVLDAVVELLPLPPLDVLDVGCGEGRLGEALTKRGYDVVGVDSDPTMVRLARERHAAELADATALPFPAERFGAVVSSHVLMEVADLDAALAEISRVTGRGGGLVVVIEHPFSSASRVDRYSRPERYGWSMAYNGIDLGLGGIHRPLGAYVQALERAGFQLESLRETALPEFDPLSLVLSAYRSNTAP